jgi:AcrR family transcriptional regulator
MVDAAVEVFRGRVPAEVTFDEVAEAAQVSRALVYNYFGDRHGLLAAVHERVFAELQERVAAEIGDVTDFRSAVFGLVRAHVQFAAADLDRYRLALDALGGAGDHGAERLAAAVKGFGSGPTAELAARGEAAALGAMVTSCDVAGDRRRSSDRRERHGAVGGAVRSRGTRIGDRSVLAGGRRVVTHQPGAVLIPPSTVRTAPVIHDANGEHRKTTASATS